MIQLQLKDIRLVFKLRMHKIITPAFFSLFCRFITLLFCRISQSISDAHIEFTKAWMQSHIDDAENFLGMPVVFSEFGVSAKDPGYNSTYRDNFLNTVYRTVLNSTKKGGGGGGSLFWQLFPQGTDYMDDGYAVVLSRSPSTSDIVSLQSVRLKTFNSLCSWRCHWGCKKRHHPGTAFPSHDEL